MKIRSILIAASLLLMLEVSLFAESTPEGDELVRQLVTAAAKGDQEGLLKALADGADINGKHEGYTAWASAKRTGYVQLAELLELKGAKSDIEVLSAEELLTHRMTSVFGESTPACALLVAKDGKIVFEKTSGQANIADKIPAAIDTKFRIGSVTKQFTAAAILKLQEDGKLSVKDPISKYLPNFPRGDEITLYHLLTHTSGMINYTSKLGFMQSVTEATTETDLIDSFKDDPFSFEPGEKFEYCNSGYFLLGHIAGKVAGCSFAEYLDKTFFQPLEMTNSGIHSPELALKNEATGYSVIGDATEPAINWHMSRAGGAGAIYSTLHDLFKWNEALYSGKVLNSESLKAAVQPTTLNDGSTSDYGYGLIMGEQRGLKTVSHSGGLDGFLTYLVRYPKQKLTIVAFTNVYPNGTFPPPTLIGNQVGEIMLWEEMESREVQLVDDSVDRNSFGDYVGRYDYSGVIMEVTLEDDKLFAQLTGQPKFEIFPKGDSTFFWKVVEAEVTFERDDSGKVIKAVHSQGGIRSENKRMSDVEAVKLTAEQLDAFVGRYDYGAAVMVVTRKGNQLTAQLTGQPAFEIYPKSKTKFFWTVVEAEVEFVKDEQGKVTKGIHTQGGRSVDVAKIEDVKGIELTEEQLDQYVGNYSYGLLAGKMNVTREGGKLMAKLRGQPALEIVPVAKDEFRWKDVNASIKFERDANGKITNGLHTQGGQTIKVPRVK